MNELQVAYQAFSFPGRDTPKGVFHVHTWNTLISRSVMDTQGGAEPESGVQRPGLWSQGWPPRLWNLGQAAWPRATGAGLKGQEMGACLGLQRLLPRGPRVQ